MDVFYQDKFYYTTDEKKLQETLENITCYHFTNY